MRLKREKQPAQPGSPFPGTVPIIPMDARLGVYGVPSLLWVFKVSWY